MSFIPPLLVSGCVNSHCPVFHFELGVQVSSVLRMKSGLTFLGRGVKPSETAEWGAVAGPHQRRWPGLPDPGLRPASPQLPLGQNTVSSFRFKFQLTSFQVSVLSSSHRTLSPSLLRAGLGCEKQSEKSVVLTGELLAGRSRVDRAWVCGPAAWGLSWTLCPQMMTSEGHPSADTTPSLSPPLSQGRA